MREFGVYPPCRSFDNFPMVGRLSKQTDRQTNKQTEVYQYKSLHTESRTKSGCIVNFQKTVSILCKAQITNGCMRKIVCCQLGIYRPVGALLSSQCWEDHLKKQTDRQTKQANRSVPLQIVAYREQDTSA